MEVRAHLRFLWMLSALVGLLHYVAWLHKEPGQGFPWFWFSWNVESYSQMLPCLPHHFRMLDAWTDSLAPPWEISDKGSSKKFLPPPFCCVGKVLNSELQSTTQWKWVWVNSGSWWWTGKPDVLQSMGSQSWTRLSNWTNLNWAAIFSSVK